MAGSRAMVVTSHWAQAVVKEYQCREEHPVAYWEAYSLQARDSGNLVSYAQSETLIADTRVSHGLGRECRFLQSCPFWKMPVESGTAWRDAEPEGR